MEPPPLRVLRIIARLNIGGPAHQVTILSGRLDPMRYETLLVAGHLGPGEGSFESMVERNGARLHRLPTLGPDLHPIKDARALWALVRLMRRFRPDIVHTHTAKAGALGRVAARLALGRRPILVHSYHGHVLRGYFGPAKTSFYRVIEQVLSRTTDCLIGGSANTVEELVAMRVAPLERFRVLRTGIDLEPFLQIEDHHGAALRAEWGIAEGEFLALFTGRLVPIKRVDVLLKGVAQAHAGGTSLRVLIVGDGELRQQLEEQVQALGLADIVTFLGFRHDLPAILAASDVLLLSSDNEAVPLSVVEAAAAGKPAVATDVGGVSELVSPTTGYLVPPGDPEAMARCIAQAATEPSRRRALGEAARAQVLTEYSSERLVRDIDLLYKDLVARRRSDTFKKIG
ncbi:MAG: glycosyltransferase [Solirubrobacteraceae bacterium]